MSLAQQNTWVAERARTEHQKAVLAGVEEWAAFYRENIHRFASDFLNIKLKDFQAMTLNMMADNNTSVIIGSRGIGKTYLSAIFITAMAILYPGSRICVASGVRSQAINVLNKILVELRPNSPALALEIEDKGTNINNTSATIMFKNTSQIKVVTASDSARGNRCNILLIDEYRMVKKDVVDTILRKFTSGGMRRPKYLDNPLYEHIVEPTKVLYLSSAFYQDHWSFTRCRDSARFMLDEAKKNFCVGYPYQLAVREGLLQAEAVSEEMSESDFNEIKWSMEMESVFWGNSTGSFFDYSSIAKNRHIMCPMYPSEISSKFPGAQKIRITPKQPGEIRLISVDIALMASTKNKNDASAIFINQMLPTKAKRYINNIIYTETNEGFRTEEEAIKIRKLFDEYDCDYIVLDGRNVGLSVYDALSRDLVDPLTGETYPALSCCNSEEFASRCVSKTAKKSIWIIQGSARFNSDIAVLLREGFRSNRIRLLCTEMDGEEYLSEMKGFTSLSTSVRAMLMAPYVNTTLLISELINLKHEETNGMVKVSERSGMRKDRYSSLAYCYWVSLQLEKKSRKETTTNFDGTENMFVPRPPRNFRERSWRR